jgi:hypothetical protein
VCLCRSSSSTERGRSSKPTDGTSSRIRCTKQTNKQALPRAGPGLLPRSALFRCVRCNAGARWCAPRQPPQSLQARPISRASPIRSMKRGRFVCVLCAPPLVPHLDVVVKPQRRRRERRSARKGRREPRVRQNHLAVAIPGSEVIRYPPTRCEACELYALISHCNRACTSSSPGKGGRSSPCLAPATNGSEAKRPRKFGSLRSSGAWGVAAPPNVALHSPYAAIRSRPVGRGAYPIVHRPQQPNLPRTRRHRNEQVGDDEVVLPQNAF